MHNRQFTKSIKAKSIKNKVIKTNSIKTNSIKINPFKRVISLILMCFLVILSSACSNKPTPNDDQKTAGDLKNISKSIVDMVDDPQQKEPHSASKITANADVTKPIAPIVVRNLYLEQQKTATSGLALSTVENYKKALSLIDKKQWQQATVLLDEIIKTQPQLSGVYYNKAVIAKAQHKNVIALYEINRAIKANELNLYAHHLKGQLLRLKGDFANAEKSYLTALSIWPNYADVHVNMGVLLELYRGRLLDAHQYYKSYLVLVPEDQQVKRYLAGLEIKIKRAGLVLPQVASEAKTADKAQVLPEKGQ